MWAQGDPAFDLLNTDEANETGGVSPALLAAHGWPLTGGTALLDEVPVLDLVARLEGGEALLSDGYFPDNLPSLLAALPSSAHLVGATLEVSWAAGPDWLHAEVHTTPAEDGPSVSFSVFIRHLDGQTAAGIFGHARRDELAALSGLPLDDLNEAPREVRQVFRPW
ncbi:MAG: hypothetical protein JNJ54_14870 [Myxococcaceae bacterium]|nr:hypothetical protein [Myxococcaceae bacterium]